MLKKFLNTTVTLAILIFAAAGTAHSGISVGVNIDIPLPTIVIQEPPEFIFPSTLGFYVAVGVPYDLYQVDNVYFLFRDNRWYKGPYYNGPWHAVEYSRLPKVLRRHNHERIRYYRDEEYRYYQRDRHRYKGHYYRPDRVEQRHEDYNRDSGGHHGNHHHERYSDDQGYDGNDKPRGHSEEWNPWLKKK